MSAEPSDLEIPTSEEIAKTFWDCREREIEQRIRGYKSYVATVLKAVATGNEVSSIPSPRGLLSVPTWLGSCDTLEGIAFSVLTEGPRHRVPKTHFSYLNQFWKLEKGVEVVGLAYT
jgi:hypothetical protein